ncbi:unnamed protein product (macronuclear) [Paramecium tetraurelia]|uniref:UDENN domain-containing protein n=1 Tax=Paramecium tetraurelia TaxID=5888 RepID=A0CPR0_PARTE|nr:uncharacterized protein GSPATT00009169001 [Paramecium tetraurelia]CAK72777.1 unnamed protein product [Paramecium tetraurelia]|eukprot:XP_001440174.1 hypothetical protein (macronuclear) [Paramecium tetraurelia strain d4-2]
MDNNIEKDLLLKSQTHADSLLKMVKKLKSENQALLTQIQQLQKQLSILGDNSLFQKIQSENLKLTQENEQLVDKYKELQQQIYDLKLQNANLQQQLNQPKQGIPKISSSITNEELYSKCLQLEFSYKKSQQDNDQLIQKNSQLMNEKNQLFEELQKVEELYKQAKSQSNLSMSMSMQTMELSQQIIAQNDYNKSQIIHTKQKDCVKLIQEFYIISVPITSIKYQNPEPMVLFKHPIQCDQELKTLFQVLPLFAFPRGIKCQTTQQAKKDILRVLQDEQLLDFSIQVFTPNKDSGKDIKNEFIQNTNPDQLLYAVIVSSPDFIADKKLTNSHELVQQKKLGNPAQNIYLSNVAFVILTYYPYHKLFYQIVKNIITTLKYERNQLSKQAFDQEYDLRSIDQYYFTNHENEIRKYLDQVQQLTLTKIIQPIKLFDNTEFIQNTQLSPILYNFELAPNNLLQGWSASNFVLAFQAVILESKVAIINRSQKYIAYLMILLSFCIKPLNYFHPFILDVPEKLMPLLDAPVPVFLGLQMEEFRQFNDDVVYVNTISSNVEIENVERLKSNLLIELENQIKPVLCNSNIILIKKIEQLLNIFKDFMNQALNRIKSKQAKDLFLQKIEETQIYQMYK